MNQSPLDGGQKDRTPPDLCRKGTDDNRRRDRGPPSWSGPGKGPLHTGKGKRTTRSKEKFSRKTDEPPKKRLSPTTKTKTQDPRFNDNSCKSFRNPCLKSNNDRQAWKRKPATLFIGRTSSPLSLSSLWTDSLVRFVWPETSHSVCLNLRPRYQSVGWKRWPNWRPFYRERPGVKGVDLYPLQGWSLVPKKFEISRYWC